DLIGQPYRGESAMKALGEAKRRYPDSLTGLEELQSWLIRSIEV
ncbi:MAG TPA: hypothetical protein PL182_08525, partial [Pseudobdellovibrionaceae bacterium]|nr:hypothetical protein [Pseudobdellovibrionaceae bacterium]